MEFFCLLMAFLLGCVFAWANFITKQSVEDIRQDFTKTIENGSQQPYNKNGVSVEIVQDQAEKLFIIGIVKVRKDGKQKYSKRHF